MTDEDFGTFDLPSHAEQMLRGMDRFAESVKRTLGPKDDFFSRFSSPEPSPEDLTAWGINADDPYEVMGARVLTEAAIDTNRLAGGGATTTTILGESILRDSTRLFYNGIDPVDLRDGIELAARHAVRTVKRHAYKVLTADHSTQVGTIAADGDREIGRIVGRTVSPEARQGRITIAYMSEATPGVRLVSARGGHGTGAEVMQRIAVPMIGGMVSSTLLTLIVIPAIYAVIKGAAVRLPSLSPSLQRT